MSFVMGVLKSNSFTNSASSYQVINVPPSLTIGLGDNFFLGRTCPLLTITGAIFVPPFEISVTLYTVSSSLFLQENNVSKTIIVLKKVSSSLLFIDSFIIL
ncbi:hypothetical protein D3C80_1470530 [compost metagenome]